MRMNCDIETYSAADLGKSGVHRYAEDPDFTVLLIGYSVDGGEVKVIDCTDTDADMDEFKRLVSDPNVIKYAFNAAFERTCLSKYLGIPMPPKEWRCTMVKSLTMGLPGNLAGAGAALGLSEDKLKDSKGKALIRYFSVPCKPTKSNGGRTRNLPAHDPDKWKLFIEYNRQDVVTEMAIYDALSKYKTPEFEQNLWAWDQDLNDRGIRIDVKMVKNIVRYDAINTEKLMTEAGEITGLSNPNSLSQLKSWLASNGAPMETVTKDSVAEKLKEDIPENVRRVLEIRQASGKTSIKKYSTMLEAVCSDGRIRGVLQFYGANRSGRWAGRLVQVHNLAKNFLPDLEDARYFAEKGDFENLEALYGEPSFVFSELVRTAFIPSEGCKFVVSDFSAIEARVIAWVAGEEWVLDAFRNGKDIYCETASMMYKVPVEKHGANSHLRQKGKIAVLACGYQGGVGAMKAMDRSGTIPENELQDVVNDWRKANPNIVKLWRDYEEAAKVAIKEGRTVTRGIRVQATPEEIAAREAMTDGRPVRKYSVRPGVNVKFSYINGNMFIKLPSGRSLCYWNAAIKEMSDGRERIVYKGVNQTTKQWEDVETYGGKIVENIVQAIARDCLAVAMMRVTHMGYSIVMHVHDEMIVDVPAEGAEALSRINSAMAEEIEWAPGLPLKGDGYECAFYKKD